MLALRSDNVRKDTRLASTSSVVFFLPSSCRFLPTIPRRVSRVCCRIPSSGLPWIICIIAFLSQYTNEPTFRTLSYVNLHVYTRTKLHVSTRTFPDLVVLSLGATRSYLPRYPINVQYYIIPLIQPNRYGLPARVTWIEHCVSFTRNYQSQKNCLVEKIF